MDAALLDTVILNEVLKQIRCGEIADGIAFGVDRRRQDAAAVGLSERRKAHRSHPPVHVDSEGNRRVAPSI
jgi:hypothetical protein